MGFLPVNMVLAKNQVGPITAELYKTAALPVVCIDLDRRYHVGQVLNTYLFLRGCQKLQV